LDRGAETSGRRTGWLAVGAARMPRKGRAVAVEGIYRVHGLLLVMARAWREDRASSWLMGGRRDGGLLGAWPSRVCQIRLPLGLGRTARRPPEQTDALIPRPFEFCLTSGGVGACPGGERACVWQPLDGTGRSDMRTSHASHALRTVWCPASRRAERSSMHTYVSWLSALACSLAHTHTHTPQSDEKRLWTHARTHARWL
jgi:hypothetical protein